MPRKESLEKLYLKLLERRQELLRSVSDGLDEIKEAHGGTAGSDDVDVAFDASNRELTSRLAEHESREIAQIDRLIERYRQGNYGKCARCEKEIPIARLKALPHTALCIECQRELESNPDLAEEFSL